MLEWDDSDPARPIAVVDVECSAGTYIRALARDLGARLGDGRLPRRARADRVGRLQAGGRDPARRAARARGGRAGRDRAAALRPIDAGLEDLPHAPVTADEIRRLGEGLITAPKAPLVVARRAARARRRARTGGSPPSAGPSPAPSTRTRCSPSDPPTPGRPTPRSSRRRRRWSRAEHATSRAGLETSLAPRSPVFVVVGVFDGLHLGHAYLLEHLVAEAARRGRPARGDHLRPPSRRDPHRLRAAPPVRPGRAPRAPRRRRRGHHGRRPLRPAPARDDVRRVRGDDRGTGPRWPGFLMTPDAAFGYRRAGTPETLAALGASAGFEVVVVPPFELDGRPVRSTEVRAAIAAGDLATATHLLGRAHCVVGSGRAAGDGAGEPDAVPAARRPAPRRDISRRGGTGPCRRHRTRRSSRAVPCCSAGRSLPRGSESPSSRRDADRRRRPSPGGAAVARGVCVMV